MRPHLHTIVVTIKKSKVVKHSFKKHFEVQNLILPSFLYVKTVVTCIFNCLEFTGMSQLYHLEYINADCFDDYT